MKKIIILFFIIALIKTTYPQVLLYPKLPADPINDLYYINDSEIIFVNDGGCILKSIDAGNTWKLKAYFNNLRLSQINFINSTTGFVYPNSSNTLISTNDGGNSWQQQELTITDAKAILPVSEAIMLKATYDGNILRLDNFYNKWDTTYKMATYIDSTIIIDGVTTHQTYIRYVPCGSIKTFKVLPAGDIIAMADNDNALGKGIITDSVNFLLKSTDQGLTWDTLWIGLKSEINKIAFNDDSVGWMSDSYYPCTILKTTNGGKDWVTQKVLDNYFMIYDLFELNSESVYILTNVGLIKSTNSGTDWEVINVDLGYLSKFFSHDKNNGFIYGYSTFFRTSNSGNSWTNVDSSIKEDLISTDFINVSNGLALSRNGIYKTTDGGHNWVNKFSDPINSNSPNGMVMTNDSDGWAIPAWDKIYKTTDSGETWNEIYISNKESYYNGIAFYNENLGLIYSISEETTPHVFEARYRLVTTDGGKNWSRIEIDSNTQTSYFDKVKFVDPQHLWALNRNALWLSKDTARTWKKMFGESNFIGTYSFDFYDTLHGVFTESSYNAFITTDGGQTWKQITKPEGCQPNDVKILGPNVFGEYRALECGRSGLLMEYDFNGTGEITYSSVLASYTKKSLNDISVCVKDGFPYVWIAGEGFTILYRQYEKIITAVKDKEIVSNQFDLQQNFPNPFNPSTEIIYKIPKPGLVQLKIYDILGREIVALVNEVQTSGVHKKIMHGESWPSGIYFYRLKAGDFISTKKMVLLK
ncbi:MAG: YCF48-related protein [Ignavibacteriaceae bacterium]